jgi:hypothetical protein
MASVFVFSYQKSKLISFWAIHHQVPLHSTVPWTQMKLFLIYSKEVLLINLCLDLAKMVDTATYIALKDTMAEERTNKRRKKNLCEFCLESRSVLPYSLLLGLVDGSAWKFTARSED